VGRPLAKLPLERPLFARTHSAISIILYYCIARMSTGRYIDRYRERYTTGINLFVEFLKHSAKPEKHSANALPSVTLDKESSANYTSATASFPSTFYRALDKIFAECHLVLSKEKSPSQRLLTATEPVPSVHCIDTRQRVYI
jgi:hypothetical protein